MILNLNERKIKILEAIINDYIQTAEPVGSRTIAKKYSLGISSATIRNEMSDLEDLGLILQPHTSSGRIPSDKGYRLYVDKLMQHRELTEKEIGFLQQLVFNNISQIDYLMQEAARTISVLTNYTTIVSEPKLIKTKIKHIQLVPLDDSAIIIVLVTDGNIAKNYMLKIQNPPKYERLTELSGLLNAYLKNVGIEDIDSNIIKNLLNGSGENGNIIMPILDTIINALSAEDNVQVYTSGAKNMLSFPEFSNVEKAKAIFKTLEEKDILITLLNKKDNKDSIQIVIGSENDIDEMKDCSLIKANYFLENYSCGSIGIIGPTRMDYSQAVSVLSGIVKRINDILKALSGG